MKLSKLLMKNEVVLSLWLAVCNNGIWIAGALTLVWVPAMITDVIDYHVIIGLMCGSIIGGFLGLRVMGEGISTAIEAEKYYAASICNGDQLLKDAEGIRDGAKEVVQESIDQLEKLKGKAPPPEALVGYVNLVKEKIKQAHLNTSLVYHLDNDFTGDQFDFFFDQLEDLILKTKNLTDYKREEQDDKESDVSEA